MKHEHWKQQQINLLPKLKPLLHINIIRDMWPPAIHPFIKNIRLLVWQFWGHVQCTIYCLAMLWEIILLLVDLVCGMWVGTLQNEKTTTTCCRLLLGSYVMKRYNHSQYIRALHWNFSMDMWQKKQGIKKARGFTFHKKGETNSPRSISAMRVIEIVHITYSIH